MAYQGPIQPGTSEKTFRETGKTQRLFQGPVRPGRDEEYFRMTGESKSRGTNPKEELKDFQREQARQKILEQRAIIREKELQQRAREFKEKAERQAQIKAGKVKSKKPLIYYSSNLDWKPKDSTSEVVYITKQGKTTGTTSSGLNIPMGFDVRAKYYKKGKSGQTVAGTTLLSSAFTFVEKPKPTKSMTYVPEDIIAPSGQIYKEDIISGGKRQFSTGTIIKDYKEPKKSESVSWAYQPGWKKKYIADPLQMLGESSGTLISLGGKLDYKPSTESAFAPTKITQSKTGRGSTGVFTTKSYGELTPEQKYKYTTTKAISDIGIKSKIKEEVSREKWKGFVETGQVTPTVAQSKYESELSSFGLGVSKEFQSIQKEAKEKYVTDMFKATLPLTVAKGAVFGGVSALVAPIGYALATTEAGSFLTSPSSISMAKQYPGWTGLHLGAGMLGARAGGFAIESTVPKGIGLLRTTGKQRVAPESIIPKDVISGKTKYPSAPTSKHMKLFKESKFNLPDEKPSIIKLKGYTGTGKTIPSKYYKDLQFKVPKKKVGVWHGSPQPLGKALEVYGSNSELPMLYVAPELSATFMKISSGKYTPFGWGRSAIEILPTASRIYPKGFKYGKPDVNYPGYVFIPKTKTEIEGGLPLGTKLAMFDSSYYSKFKGTRFPIQKFKVLGEGEKAPVGTKVITYGEYLKSYSFRTSKTPFFTPSSVGYGLSSSKKSYSLPYKISSPKYSSLASFGSSSKPPISFRRLTKLSSVSSLSRSSRSKVSRGSFKTPQRNVFITPQPTHPPIPQLMGFITPQRMGFITPQRNVFKTKGVRARLPTTRRTFRPPRRSPSLLAITQGIWSKTPFRAERSSLGIRPMLFAPTKKKKRGKHKK